MPNIEIGIEVVLVCRLQFTIIYTNSNTERLKNWTRVHDNFRTTEDS